MRTGQLAKGAGVNAQTLRYYERRGILARPARTESGYRRYPEEAVRRVRFVKHAQELGFTLTEIEELLRLRDARGRGCGEVRAAAEIKRSAIDDKIAHLRAMRKALDLLVDSCRRNSTERSCPLLEAFDSDDPQRPGKTSRAQRKRPGGASRSR
jgi:Hg(II)-responsive transcriptional regulator